MDENHPQLSATKPSKSSSLFNRSITLNSSVHPFPIKKWINPFQSAGNSFKGKVKHLRTLFETPKTLTHPPPPLRPSKSVSSDFKDCWSILDASTIRFPGTEDRVVVYYTSLGGIRRTYEDCHGVRKIFQGFKVFVDERDVSMDVEYRKELQGLLGENKNNVCLPQVFIKGRYVGGVDVIRHLNESGELRKILQVLPAKDRRFCCDVCGDVRFLLCLNCNGSSKVFDEDENVMNKCLQCNENGLIRCPQCCS